MASRRRVQRIAFIRHGVARHNLPDPLTGGRPNFEDPALTDPPLTREGKAMAIEAGERACMWWRTTGSGEEIDLVVTSPLTRCIQTTVLGFLPGTKYAEGRREPKMVCSELARFMTLRCQVKPYELVSAEDLTFIRGLTLRHWGLTTRRGASIE